MTQYLMSVYYDERAVQPAPEELAEIGKNIEAVHQQLQAEGAWIFGGGLHDRSRCDRWLNSPADVVRPFFAAVSKSADAVRRSDEGGRHRRRTRSTP